MRKLRNSGHGCHIGPHYIGSVAYADDIVLLSPTLNGLKSLASVCEEYSKEYGLTFNASKSQFIIFNNGRRYKERQLCFCDNMITNQKKVVHLGHTLFSNVKLDDADGIIASFYKQFNAFKSRFGKVPGHIQSVLFKQYCSSFYGVNLVKYMNYPRLQVVWRKALRSVWNLPYKTHCKILACLENSPCDKHLFISRFVKFAVSVLSHHLSVVMYVFNTVLNDKQSVFSQNFRHCCEELKLSKEHILNEIKCINVTVKDICHIECRDATNKCKAATVREICMIRDDMSECFFI